MKNLSRSISVQLLIWTTLLVLQLILLPQLGQSPTIFEDFRFYHTVIAEDLLILLVFYFNYLFLVPQLLGKQLKKLYLTSVVLLLVLFLFFPVVLKSLFGIEYSASFNDKRILSEWLALLGLMTIGVSLGIRSVREWMRCVEKDKKLQLRCTQMELDLIKSQINPHFLFNTLDTLHVLSLQNSEKTSEAILRLSTMMRFVMSDAKNDFVPLEKEIEYIKQYAELQKLRYGDKIDLKLVITDDCRQAQIAPLILIPFIENAFKYGISSQEVSPILLKLEVDENRILFEMLNKKFRGESIKTPGKGASIANTRRRLEILYPKRHKLHIKDEVDSFSVNLVIESI